MEYKIVINGVEGNAKLLEALEFTAEEGGSAADLAGWNGVILPAGAETNNGEDVGETGLITLTAHMKEDAGNEYQGLSISGISITVTVSYTHLSSCSDAAFLRHSSPYRFDRSIAPSHTLTTAR